MNGIMELTKSLHYDQLVKESMLYFVLKIIWFLFHKMEVIPMEQD
jgi:hypothetical protein